MVVINLIRIRWPVLFLAIAIWSNAQPQVILNGTVTNNKTEPLPRINILISLPGSKTIIAFAVSDEHGNFQATVNSPSDSFQIEVSSVNYRNEIRTIANVSQHLTFTLTAEVMELESFTVKAPAIKRQGDTISYLVSSFEGKEDRTIEDVLRKMPGIEVQDDGQILYQGQPIQKFYVEGLDLMEGRYSMVSKNLPNGAVSTVEVLENHQPIRMLEDKVYSTQASINLKLKKGISTTGTAKVGAGLSPFLWEANITPMTFSKKFQLLSSYQTNNTGKDVAGQLAVLTFDELIKNKDRPEENPGILNIQKAKLPDIEENRYIDNQIHLINLNGLAKLNRDFQLRSNLYYISDLQKEKARELHTLYTGSDTIQFEEKFDNQKKYDYVYGEFSLNRNVKNNYLNNTLKLKYNNDRQSGLVKNGSQNISQKLNDPIRSISNELRSINPIGNKLIEIESYISYDHNPHNLTVYPGKFSTLTPGLDYNNEFQELELKRFYTDNSAGIVFNLGKFIFTPKAGFIYREQLLESNLLFRELFGGEAGDTSLFKNDMKSNLLKGYLNTNMEYKTEKLSITAQLPMGWQTMKIEDVITDQGQDLQNLIIEPRFSFNYKINSFWKFRTSWSYKNRPADFDQTFYGYILRNYRYLSKNDAPIAEISGQSVSARISYRNPINSFFNSFTYVYSLHKTSLTYQQYISSDGTSLVLALELPQTNNFHSFQLYSSKFFSDIKSTLSLRINYTLQNGQSLINEEHFDTENHFYNIKPSLNVRITNWLNSDYELDASYIQTFVENNNKNDITFLKHKLNFFAFPFKRQMISLNTEYYNYKESNSFFMDLSYQYTIKKPEIDLELSWNNIFNTDLYTSLQSSGSSVLESSYQLRPTQILLTVRFGFR